MPDTHTQYIRTAPRHPAAPHARDARRSTRDRQTRPTPLPRAPTACAQRARTPGPVRPCVPCDRSGTAARQRGGESYQHRATHCQARRRTARGRTGSVWSAKTSSSLSPTSTASRMICRVGWKVLGPSSHRNPSSFCHPRVSHPASRPPSPTIRLPERAGSAARRLCRPTMQLARTTTRAQACAQDAVRTRRSSSAGGGALGAPSNGEVGQPKGQSTLEMTLPPTTSRASVRSTSTPRLLR